MKETKVYIDELPESCTDCHCYDFDMGGCQCKDPHFTYDSINRFKGCPLIDIKTHDRELVKEVCEKIKNNVNDMPYYDDRTGYVSPTDVCEMIDELQKEFEK